jgi:response regulator RpfG family c-di-GMP phosphodiesterase
MHDIGKVGIPDSILNKPGRHTPEEWEIMKTHAQIGHDMLAGSHRPILRAAATVAISHHEKWDGSGYPGGHKGENIHIYGRITALADVFDALGSDRCYKEAWPLDRILEFLKRESGRHFEPRLVDLLLANLPEFLAVRDALRDV